MAICQMPKSDGICGGRLERTSDVGGRPAHQCIRCMTVFVGLEEPIKLWPVDPFSYRGNVEWCIKGPICHGRVTFLSMSESGDEIWACDKCGERQWRKPKATDDDAAWKAVEDAARRQGGR